MLCWCTCSCFLSSRVLARLTSLAQIGELARRLKLGDKKLKLGVLWPRSNKWGLSSLGESHSKETSRAPGTIPLSPSRFWRNACHSDWTFPCHILVNGKRRRWPLRHFLSNAAFKWCSARRFVTAILSALITAFTALLRPCFEWLQHCPNIAIALKRLESSLPSLISCNIYVRNPNNLFKFLGSTIDLKR